MQPIVRIDWADAAFVDHEHDLEGFARCKSCSVAWPAHSVGFLVGTSKSAYTLATDIFPGVGHIRSFHVIPKQMVDKITYLTHSGAKEANMPHKGKKSDYSSKPGHPKGAARGKKGKRR